MVPAVQALVAAILACQTPTPAGLPRDAGAPRPGSAAAVARAAGLDLVTGPPAVAEALGLFREEADERAEDDDDTSGRSRPSPARLGLWPDRFSRPAGTPTDRVLVSAAGPIFLLCGRLTC